MNYMKHNQKQLRTNQQGMVSIIVVMIVMGIMVLISTSFALLMSRERRQALDRQLSTQAFYAAESGVNDAISKMDTITSDITDCSNTPGLSGGQNVLDAEGNMRYTCVLVDKSPDTLVYDPIGTDDSTVVRLESATTNISRIDISWQDSSEGGVGTQFVPATNTSHLLPQKNVADADTTALTASDGTGILRTTFMPITSNPITRNSLINDARTYFLYPKAGGVNGFGTANFGGNAQFVDGSCNTAHTNKNQNPNYCNAQITTAGNTKVIYLRLLAVYRPVAVRIKVFNAAGEQTEILNAQAIIDSTGRATDVLRRIQVRVPLSGGYKYPDYAVETMDSICKRTGFPIGGNGRFPETQLPAEGPGTNQLDYNRAIDQAVCDAQTP